MIKDFKHMQKSSPKKPQAYVVNHTHSAMTNLDRIIPERLTHDKIVKNFEYFASREKFKEMPDWLQKLFYQGGAQIINQAINSAHDIVDQI